MAEGKKNLMGTCSRAVLTFLLGFSLLLLAACAGIDPANVDVELKKTAPVTKITSYTKALQQLGLMSEIYGSIPLKVQSNPIGDNTGTSGATGGEIPRDITEMIKSSLNSIGGKITFIPYDPAFIQNQMVTGYSTFDNKLIPDVVISGGITEFDRGLETRGEGTDVSASADFTNAPSFMPTKTVGIDYGESGKTGLARITLDFNLLDFKTMAGVPRMNTVNSMEVHKALAEEEFGITLFGPTFGRKGSIKKVEGRHAAVRLLVELSMTQIVGKYLNLPYWVLLGEDVQADEVVMSRVEQEFYSISESARVKKAQEWLFLMGEDVALNGKLDDKTVAALKNFDPAYGTLDFALYANLFQSVPIDAQTMGRKRQLGDVGAPMIAAPAVVETQQVFQSQPVADQQPAYEPEPEPAPTPTVRRSIGRKLSDSDW